jgi:hypothetical protein
VQWGQQRAGPLLKTWFKSKTMEQIGDALKRYELVELVIPAGSTGTRFPYPDIPQLRNDTTQDIIICGLETFSVDELPLTANGNAVATWPQLANSFLTLYVNSEESVRQVPLIRLNPLRQAAGGGVTFNASDKLKLEYLQIDWNKTYIQAATPYGTILAPNTQFSILLGVWYKKLLPGAWAMMTKNQQPGW